MGIVEEEFSLRMGRIDTTLKEKEFDGLLVYSNPWRRDAVRYLTNYRLGTAPAYAFLRDAGDVTLFVATLEEKERAERESWAHRVVLLGGSGSELAEEVRRDKRAKRIGISDPDYIPGLMIERLQKERPDLEIISFSRELNSLRMIKSAYEITRLRRAAQLADEGFQAFLRHTRPGVKQYELIAEVERVVREAGAEDNFMLIASGGLETRAMSAPRNKELRAGEMVLTEVTPQYDGYWTQICRSIVLGDISNERQKAFEIFLRATDEALKIAKPGVAVSKLAKVQNDVFRQEGFGEYTTPKWTRSRGHGQGLHLDEPPLIEEESQATLQEGMLIIIHPNTYLPISGYMVFGDPTLITADGPEFLTGTARQLFSV